MPPARLEPDLYDNAPETRDVPPAGAPPEAQGGGDLAARRDTHPAKGKHARQATGGARPAQLQTGPSAAHGAQRHPDRPRSRPYGRHERSRAGALQHKCGRRALAPALR